jgi:hypothetical protein
MYTYPAPIPATNAPVKMLNNKHFINTIPINLIFLRYANFKTSWDYTGAGLMRRQNECHNKAE